MFDSNKKNFQILKGYIDGHCNDANVKTALASLAESMRDKTLDDISLETQVRLSRDDTFQHFYKKLKGENSTRFDELVACIIKGSAVAHGYSFNDMLNYDGGYSESVFDQNMELH